MKTHISALLTLLCLTFLLLCSSYRLGWYRKDPLKVASSQTVKFRTGGRTLVSYAYFEKDAIQRLNLAFFLLKGVGITYDGFKGAPRNTDFQIVVSGTKCTPCVALQPHIAQVESVLANIAAWSGRHLTLLHRVQNVGMDFAAHNVNHLTNFLARIMQL